MLPATGTGFLVSWRGCVMAAVVKSTLREGDLRHEDGRAAGQGRVRQTIVDDPHAAMTAKPSPAGTPGGCC
jgi:hypothetical protein